MSIPCIREQVQNARKNVSKNNPNYGDILLRTYHANDRRSVVKKLQSVTVKGLLVCAGEDLRHCSGNDSTSGKHCTTDIKNYNIQYSYVLNTSHTYASKR